MDVVGKVSQIDVFHGKLKKVFIKVFPLKSLSVGDNVRIRSSRVGEELVGVVVDEFMYPHPSGVTVAGYSASYRVAGVAVFGTMLDKFGTNSDCFMFLDNEERCDSINLDADCFLDEEAKQKVFKVLKRD